MKQIASMAVLVLAAALGGCGTLTTGVSVAGAPGGAVASGAGYAFARTDAQGDDADYTRVETLVRNELAARGLVEQPLAQAAYRVTLGYVTQPAGVAVATEGCGGKAPPCVAVDGAAPFGLPFAGKVYRHTLTVRFVDAKTGAVAYRVTAAVQDRHGEALEAAPVLVQSALLRVPYTGDGWVVRSKEDGEGAARALRVLSVKPAQ